MSENVVLAPGPGKISDDRGPGHARRSRLNSVATADALVQERSIWVMPAAVATKLTGVAGKTVAEETSDGAETWVPSPSARTRYMYVTPSCKPGDASVAPVGERVRRGGNRRTRRPPVRALDPKTGGRRFVVGPRQGHRTIIDCYRGQILRGRRWEYGLAGVAGGNTRSIDALRPLHAVRVIGADARRHPASGESEKQHQRNEDRRNAENEDEPVHGSQAEDCCEWAAPPTRVMNSRRLMGLTPKAKDRDLTITPRIAAGSSHLRRLRVKSRPCRKLSEGKQKSEPGFWTKRFRGNERIDEAIPAPPCSSRARLRHRPRGSCR